MARHTTRPRAAAPDTGRRDFWERLRPIQSYASASESERVQQELHVYDDRDEHGTVHVQIQRERKRLTLTWSDLEDLDEFIADLQDARSKL